MKQSETLIPCCFDDKDIMLPEFWESVFDYGTYIPYCIGKRHFETLFYLPCVEGDRAFKANIPYHAWNKIEVTCLQDNGTIWVSDVKKLEEIFMPLNNEEDSDIYVTCEPTQEHDGRYVALTFKYYHTDV